MTVDAKITTFLTILRISEANSLTKTGKGVSENTEWAMI
jgi:hypothetical protein